MIGSVFQQKQNCSGKKTAWFFWGDLGPAVGVVDQPRVLGGVKREPKDQPQPRRLSKLVDRCIKRPFSLSFSYVCPEPVLANNVVFSVKMVQQRCCSRTRPPAGVQAEIRCSRSWLACRWWVGGGAVCVREPVLDDLVVRATKPQHAGRQRYAQRHFCFEFSLCLSRACLGKMIHFIYEWRKSGVSDLRLGYGAARTAG
jgi:hypothetical protein